MEPQYNKTPREWKNVFLITGFVILGFFSIHFTITGQDNMVHYTGVFIISVVPENIHTPRTEGIGNSWEGGGSQRSKNLKQCM